MSSRHGCVAGLGWGVGKEGIEEGYGGSGEKRREEEEEDAEDAE